MSIILNRGQQKILEEAIDWYRNSSEQVFEIAGPAGSGKSVLIYEILRALHLPEYKVAPMAYTGQASIIMRTKGFKNARSIHSTLYEVVEYYDDSAINTAFSLPTKKKKFQLRQAIDPRIDLFFIDEAYMVPEYMKNDILSFGKKVLVAGDPHQLPPIGGKPGFLVGSNVHRLTELMRQAEDDPIVYLAMRAMKGQPIHCGMYGNNVLVINDDEFIPEMVKFADCITCGTNRTRDTMNRYIRQLAGVSQFEIPTLYERVICRNNNWQITQNGIALTNGLCGTVMSAPDPTSFNGKAFYINFITDLIPTMFSSIPVNYNYFIANYEEKNRLKEQPREWLEGELFEFAYCLTTHLCQGSEYNKGIYIEEFLRPQIQNQLNYTGITRFKKGLIYIKKKNKYFYYPNQSNTQ